MGLRLLFILLISGTAYPMDASQYEVWSKVPRIRVGVKKPERSLTLSSSGTLLVLDGTRVVGTIKPGGRFHLVSGKSRSAPASRWIQVSARRNESLLKQTKNELEKAHPDLKFVIRKSASGLRVLRTGPFKTKAEAESARRQMVKAGYKDAFPVNERSGSAFQWVDQDYDKHNLRSSDLALVRTDPNLPIYYKGNGYRGILRFRKVGNKIRVINELPMETYLRGVVPSELGPKTYPELEALKAQAIAARTYAIKNMGRFNKRGYDICDTPACQAYEGTSNEDPLSDQAVRETESLVLYHGDQLIDALYTSTCGGQTDDVENVFPGRAEPYLRGVSSYIGEYDSWSLPERRVAREEFAGMPEDIAVKAVLYGMQKPPNAAGNMGATDLKNALSAYAWILGEAPELPKTETLSHRQFWEAIAALEFFQQATKHQIRDQDLEILLRYYQLPEALHAFAGLLIRYDFVSRDNLITLGSDDSITKAEAYHRLVRFCERLGPELDWKRYRMEGISNDLLELDLNRKKRQLNLKNTDYYITEVGGFWEFVEAPYLEEWDRIYIAQPPFSSRVLRLKESGVVASVDRFSAFDSWIEKKTISQLEKRAKRYIKGIRGIKEVRILDRAESGRVTKLEYIAESGKHQVTGLRIRWSLGVRDNLFDLLPGYQNGRLVHLTTIGRGWGHGVGMSQVGAFSLAKIGWTYDQILTHYYTGVEVKPFMEQAAK